MLLKKVKLAIAVSSGLLLSQQAFAAMDVNVHGIIAPNACIASVIGGSSLDWGIIQHESLDQTNFNTFPAKQVTLQFNCPSDQSVAIWATDPNESSAVTGPMVNGRTGHNIQARIFGLGLDPVTRNPLGNFTLNPISSTVDGTVNSVSFGYQNGGAHNGTAFGRVLNANWSYMKTEDWTPWDEKTSKPAVGKSFAWVFDVEPQLNRGDKITNSQQVDWQGTAQINVRYF